MLCLMWLGGAFIQLSVDVTLKLALKMENGISMLMCVCVMYILVFEQGRKSLGC